MTIQDLKNNREDIINFINGRNYDLKFAMSLAVELCENCEDVEELKEELINYCRPVKETKNARILAGLAEMENN